MVRRTLAARLSRALVGCYPRRWRQRYGEELLDVLDQHGAGARTVLNLGASALGAQALWNVVHPARVARIATLTRQAGGIAAPSFSPGGHLLACAGNNGAVALWNVAGPAQPAITATLRLTVPAPPAQQGGFPDVALAFSAGGHTLTTIAGNTTVTRWNVTGTGTVTRITTITGHSIGSGPVAFSPGGRTVAGAPVTGDTVALWALP